ncbi:MAG: T9SS type A sorting domain-containing protein, partial [Bacteroidales bacterium]|nr:T9SS type A sorting domain-containing protein [Bacteroidales bacterium]
NKVRINTESFNPGIYLYKVVANNKQHTGRFVISNN